MANEVLYGFVQLKDQFNERALTVGEEFLAEAINLTLADHNARIAEVLAPFVEPTLDYKVMFNSITAGQLQPLDEYGRARPVKTSKYDVAFPLQMAGTAWGANFVSLNKMTVRHVNNMTASMLLRDSAWMANHVLAGLFKNASWTFSDVDYGDLTIYGLANSDTVTYVRNGTDNLSTDTHYLAQAAAIADASNPFPAIYAELTEHPENSGDVVAFIPTANKAATTGLAEFTAVADPNVRIGADNNTIIGTPGINHPGTLLGYLEDSKVWIVEWKKLPDNYVIAITTGGERPLKMREDVEAELRGFGPKGVRSDYPYREDQWVRRAGFGAYNRVGAVVQRVGNGAYAVPTGYDSPLP